MIIRKGGIIPAYLIRMEYSACLPPLRAHLSTVLRRSDHGDHRNSRVTIGAAWHSLQGGIFEEILGAEGESGDLARFNFGA